MESHPLCVIKITRGMDDAAHDLPLLIGEHMLPHFPVNDAEAFLFDFPSRRHKPWSVSPAVFRQL